MALFWREPHPPLSAFVSTLWLADGYVPGPHRQERVMPTGADLINRIGLSHRRFLDVFTGESLFQV
jgi:hypothetical protein